MGMYLLSGIDARPAVDDGLPLVPLSTTPGQQGAQQQGISGMHGSAGQHCGMTKQSARLQHGQMQKQGQNAIPARQSHGMMICGVAYRPDAKYIFALGTRKSQKSHSAVAGFRLSRWTKEDDCETVA